MSFIERIKGTISNPNNTMKIIAQEPMIEEAVMIVGIYAALISIAAYLQSYKITLVFEGVPNMPSSMQSIMTISTIVFALITPFIIWFIIAGVIHLLSMAIGRRRQVLSPGNYHHRIQYASNDPCWFCKHRGLFDDGAADS